MRGQPVANQTPDPRVALWRSGDLELARQWLVTILELEEVWRVRRIPLAPKPPQWALTTDASPFGLGVVLSARRETWQQTIGVPFRKAAGQAALEAWAILLAIRFWRAKIRGDKLLIKSDSTVALALTKKLNSGTPLGGGSAWDAMQVSEVTPSLARSRPGSRGAMPKGLVGLTIRVPNEAWALETLLPPPGQVPSSGVVRL